MVVVAVGEQDHFGGKAVLLDGVYDGLRLHAGIDNGAVALFAGDEITIRCKAVHRYADHFHFELLLLFFHPAGPHFLGIEDQRYRPVID